MKSRPLCVTFVFEYSPAGDWMMSSLIESLRAKLPDLRPTCVSGLFATYRPGGLRPGRLANLMWVYARIAWHLLVSRPDAVLVRTSPPGVQLWTVWWAGFRGIPVLCWLMDYHPEMEARQLDRRGFARMARRLRGIDASLMRRFALIIALDRAMAALARSRAVGVEVLEHPTWTTGDAAAFAPVAYQIGGGSGTLHLAYSGNLGAAHDLDTFAILLRELVRRRRVRLFVVGASAAGEERLRKLAAGLAVPVEVHSRVAFNRLRGLYNQWRIDAGVVLLNADSAGLVSPSKFAGYINFGIPLVYLGPPETNTADVCVRFGGGFWVQSGAGREGIAEVANALATPDRLARASQGARAAAEHFGSLNSETLAGMIAPRLQGMVSPKPSGAGDRIVGGRQNVTP